MDKLSTVGLGKFFETIEGASTRRVVVGS